MKQGIQHGLDYTPLYKFLLSKVGKKWDDVYSEAVSRLNTSEPIFHLVALNAEDQKEYVRIRTSTYYSGLYVTEEGILEKVAPEINAHSLEPM